MLFQIIRNDTWPLMISDLLFIDSFQFMSSSLSNLANNLSKESFHHAKNDFDSDALKLII